LASALLALAKLAMGSETHKPRIAKKGKKRTQKGATHIQGERFVPRLVTMVWNKFDRKQYHVTPALYRRLHIKANTKPPVIKSPAPRGRNVMSQEAKELLGARNGS
jgi:hypothetical protein